MYRHHLVPVQEVLLLDPSSPRTVGVGPTPSGDPLNIPPTIQPRTRYPPYQAPSSLVTVIDNELQENYNTKVNELFSVDLRYSKEKKTFEDLFSNCRIDIDIDIDVLFTLGDDKLRDIFDRIFYKGQHFRIDNFKIEMNEYRIYSKDGATFVDYSKISRFVGLFDVLWMASIAVIVSQNLLSAVIALKHIKNTFVSLGHNIEGIVNRITNKNGSFHIHFHFYTVFVNIPGLKWATSKIRRNQKSLPGT